MADEPKIENARIRHTTLGYEDHGIFTCMLHLDYGGAGQGAGGYALDTPVHDETGRFICRQGTAFGMRMIARILKVVGVQAWEDLPGKYVRVRHDLGKVHAIGNLLVDEWLDFAAFAKEQRDAQ